MQNIVGEALRVKVMEGDTTKDIFSYMSTEAMMNATLINRNPGTGAYMRQIFFS